MKKTVGHLAWAAVAVIGAYALGTVALERGEPINSAWLLVAAVCIYLVGFRFYGKFIAARVMALDNNRATPAERLRNGHDFEPTNKWILFGQTSGFYSAITSQRSPDRDPWSALPWRPNSATCPARCGSLSAACWAERCRTS